MLGAACPITNGLLYIPQGCKMKLNKNGVVVWGWEWKYRLETGKFFMV